MKVYVVTYDWDTYGNGIDRIFSNKEKAEKYAERKRAGYGSYDVEEFDVIEEKELV